MKLVPRETSFAPKNLEVVIFRGPPNFLAAFWYFHRKHLQQNRPVLAGRLNGPSLTIRSSLSDIFLWAHGLSTISC